MTKNAFRHGIFALATITALWVPNMEAFAAGYKIDPTHSFVEFRIQHLGFSWLYGRFNTVSGEFSYDAANPETSKVSVEIDTASVDTNHAERDKHLRSDDFLDVEQYPTAMFRSTS